MMVSSITLKAKHALLCLAALSVFTTQPEQMKFLSNKNYTELDNIRNRGNCDKLCIGKILTKCLKAKQIKAENIESLAIKTDTLCANALSADLICASTINATEQICAPLLSSPAMCTEQLTATNICVSGLIQSGGGFQQCGKYRATAVFSQNTPYTLNDIVDYDLIIDDPNNNINIFPFTYTAPLTGYYILTTQVDQFNLQGADPIIGTPIANLTVDVNGNPFRDTFTPYLAFHNGQKITVTTLMSLKAGDLVSVRYNVYVMHDATGFTPYVGTVILEGNGSEDNATMFKIHYLSSDCIDLPCVPCQASCTPTLCDVPCTPVDCDNMSCCDDN